MIAATPVTEADRPAVSAENLLYFGLSHRKLDIMKWLRICALLIALVSAMRVVSWAIGWVLVRFAPGRVKFAVSAANIVVFGIFSCFLLTDLASGEPVDMAGLVFGLAVSGACCLADFHWTPWKSRR